MSFRASRRLGWLLALACLWTGVSARAQPVGLYDVRKLAGERSRLEARSRELWGLIHDNLLTTDEQSALARIELQFPTLDKDGNILGFHAKARDGVIVLPIHSLLLLEDACTAYAWLSLHGRDLALINQYAAFLAYAPSDALASASSSPLGALGIPSDALSERAVNELSLRLRSSAYTYVLAHEAGHVLHRHLPNRAVRPEVSQRDELEADEFALEVLRRDRQVPMGAILFLQMTAFTSSPSRFGFTSVEEWNEALRKETHPVTSDRVRAFANSVRLRAGEYGENRTIAREIAARLEVIASEMDDRDLQLYFRRIGERGVFPPTGASPE